MFQFKQFSIEQENCAMKVGTDGVLLGAWTNVENNVSHVLDIGTGTGLLALMLAQRTNKAIIDAIEIDENSYNQATSNVNRSTWATRITVIHEPLQTYDPQKKYDLIVSNPPYFSHSLKNPNLSRKIARHTDTLSPNELIEHTLRLLSRNGRLCVIYPTTEGLLFRKEAESKQLYCSRMTTVFPNIGAHAKRLLMEFSLMPSAYREDEIVIENKARHDYSTEYIMLTKDFYLNF
jgi:tRNA1Val (adenine37-N6)-methyltransferase